MNKEILVFDDYGVNKNAFQKRMEPIDIDKAFARRIVEPNKDSYNNKSSFKYFIGNKSGAGVVPLCIKLPQLNRYANYFDSNNKCMHFLVRNKKLLKEYNTI